MALASRISASGAVGCSRPRVASPSAASQLQASRVVCTPISLQAMHRRRVAGLTCATSPDTEEARGPLDAPQEWEPPQPSKRPDIFPEFEKMDRVFLPKPLPGDPEMPDEEEEEARKRTTPGDPDPEHKPGEPAEPEHPPEPTEPGKEAPERPGTDIPSSPE